MAHLPPRDVQPQQFSKIFRGYDPDEVDAYISALLEDYISLYNEYSQLENKLNTANERLKTVDEAEEKAKKALEVANAAGQKIISNAYERADDILASIRTNCDYILNSFRQKIDIQKESLIKIQQNVLQFKNGLFDTYRSHIEMIERISPVYELEMGEDTSPEEYVDHVINKLKEDVAKEYGMTSIEADSPTYATIPLDTVSNIDKALGQTAVFNTNPNKKPDEESTRATRGKTVDFTKPIPDSVIRERRIKENEETKTITYGDEEIDVDSMMARAVQPEKEYVPVKQGNLIKSSDEVVELINRLEDRDVIEAPQNDGEQLTFDFFDEARNDDRK